MSLARNLRDNITGLVVVAGVGLFISNGMSWAITLSDIGRTYGSAYENIDNVRQSRQEELKDASKFERNFYNIVFGIGEKAAYKSAEVAEFIEDL